MWQQTIELRNRQSCEKLVLPWAVGSVDKNASKSGFRKRDEMPQGSMMGMLSVREQYHES
jgi:hypothetical protein